MAVTYKDIDQLTQKSSVAGTEKIPVSDTEYVTANQIASLGGGGGGGTVGTLNTTATTAQSTNASESLSGSVTLHKVAKTGTYNDLIGAPTAILNYNIVADTPTAAELSGAYAAALAAINAGKIPILNLTQTTDGYTYSFVYCYSEEGRLIFNSSCGDSSTELDLNDDGTFSYLEFGLQKTDQLVTSLSSSSTDSQYPSAKAVYDEVHPEVDPSQPAGGMLPNVFYNLGTLSGDTTFAFASPSDNTIENEWMFEFTTPSTAPTITWPNAITGWAGGTAPTINASKTYQVSVLNGLGVIAEF